MNLYNKFRVTAWDLSRGTPDPRPPTGAATELAEYVRIRHANDNADSMVLRITVRKMPRDYN